MKYSIYLCQLNKFGFRSDNPKTDLKIYNAIQFLSYTTSLTIT